MYEAARLDDQIAHSRWGLGMLAGAIVGAAVLGAFVVFTGGIGLVAIVAAGAAGGAASGAFGAGRDNAGPILSGTDRVLISRMPAARAGIDTLTCHESKMIAQGSRTVFIDGFPAARIGDQTQCGGKVSQGCRNVRIGLEPETYITIESEIPWKWRVALGIATIGLSVAGPKLVRYFGRSPANNLALRLKQATGGQLKVLPKGYEILISLTKKRSIVIRVMNEGGGRTNYYRISIPGKKTFTKSGTVSTDRGETHIDITANSFDEIINIINKIKAEQQ